ncbi:MAG: hypothetical protein K1W24_05540 [Lachnospiraceae bacterium]
MKKIKLYIYPVFFIIFLCFFTNTRVVKAASSNYPCSIMVKSDINEIKQGQNITID